jgi:hypothetical protein
VWLVNNDGMRIVQPDGRVVDISQKLRGSQEARLVRILVGRSGAIVEFAGQRVWSGAHQLREGRPWFVGVRFLARSGASGQPVVFQSLRLLRGQKR